MCCWSNKTGKKERFSKTKVSMPRKIYTIEIYIARTIKVLELWESMKLYRAD